MVIILFIIDSLFNITLLFQDLSGDNEEDESYQEMYLLSGLEIIVLTLATFFLLKYKYYIHHFISIALFVILTIIIDVIVKNYESYSILSFIFMKNIYLKLNIIIY